MPQPYGQAVLTYKGEELLAKSTAGQCLIEYVCMVTGDGIYSIEEKQHTKLKKRESLKREKNRYAFSSAKLEKNAVRLTALLTNQDPVTSEGLVDEGYYINEIGIYARESGTDNAAILYSICLTASDTGIGDYMPAYAGHNRAEITQEYILYIGSNTNITVNMTGAVALAEDVQAAIDAVRQQAAEALSDHAGDKSNPHNVTKEQMELENVDNTADKNKPVSTAQQAAIDAAYEQGTGYTNQKIADLINGAPSTLDTLGEIAKAMQDNSDVVAALDVAIGKKANEVEFASHTKDTTAHITGTERTNWNDAGSKKHTHDNKSVLDGITSALISGWNSAVTHISDAVKHITGAERDKWNNHSHTYAVCSTAATTAAKTAACADFKLATGAEITVKFTVTNTAVNPTLNVGSTGAKAIYYRGSAVTAGYLAANRTYIFRYNGTQWDIVGDLDTNTKYTHPVTSGNKHIPAGGSAGQILRWATDGTAEWAADAADDKIDRTGDRMEGNLVLMGELVVNDGVNDRRVILVYDDGDAGNYGSEICFGGGGNVFLGSGESYYTLRDALQTEGSAAAAKLSYVQNSERMYITSDNIMYLLANVNNPDNLAGYAIDTAGKLMPLEDNKYSIGDSTHRIKNAYIANLTGNADTATKLKTARTIKTNLQSETAASFDGSGNATPGVSGILSEKNGGTGYAGFMEALVRNSALYSVSENNIPNAKAFNIEKSNQGAEHLIYFIIIQKTAMNGGDILHAFIVNAYTTSTTLAAKSPIYLARDTSTNYAVNDVSAVLQNNGGEIRLKVVFKNAISAAGAVTAIVIALNPGTPALPTSCHTVTWTTS